MPDVIAISTVSRISAGLVIEHRTTYELFADPDVKIVEIDAETCKNLKGRDLSGMSTAKLLALEKLQYNAKLHNAISSELTGRIPCQVPTVVRIQHYLYGVAFSTFVVGTSEDLVALGGANLTIIGKDTLFAQNHDREAQFQAAEVLTAISPELRNRIRLTLAPTLSALMETGNSL